MKAKLFKTVAAILALVPMLVLLYSMNSGKGFHSDDWLIDACLIFNFPAASLFGAVSTFHLDPFLAKLIFVILLLLWSIFMAWLFCRIVGTLLGEDEPSATYGHFDWVGFRVRFAIGFVIGFLIGWRFVKTTTSKKTVLIACIISGIVGGTIYGLSRPPDFWSRS